MERAMLDVAYNQKMVMEMLKVKYDINYTIQYDVNYGVRR